MKKIILLFIIFAIIFAGVIYFWHLNLPVKNAELPTLKMVNELTELLLNAPYEIDDYKIGVFDCSNESALMHDFLTAHGYNCTIVIGAWFEWRWFPVIFHAWIIVEKDGKKMWIDATLKQVAYQEYFNDYFVLAHFKSLLMLRTFAVLCFFPNEWSYQK